MISNNIEVIPAAETQKSVLRQLMELYCYDFSEFTGEDVDEHGFYGYSYLDYYWTEEDRHPFLIKVDGNIAGFAMVKRTHDGKAHTIAEFFVMRKYRRMNVGGVAAKYLFGLFKGDWEVRVMHVNKPAIPFWRRAINEYTDGDFIYHPEFYLESDWDWIGYTFCSE